MKLFENIRKRLRSLREPKLALKIVDEEPLILKAATLYIVGSKTLPKWALLNCPCGCSERIELYLGSKTKPRWKARFSRRGVTLRPSIWQTGGCGAHFFVTDSRIDHHVE